MNAQKLGKKGAMRNQRKSRRQSCKWSEWRKLAGNMDGDMTKPSRKLVVNLIKIWQSNGRLFWLDHENLNELKTICYAQPRWEAKMFLASNSKKANELLWDNKFQSASVWLVKYGFDTKDNNSKYSNEARSMTHQNNKLKNILNTTVKSIYEPFKKSNQWNVCK